MKKEFVRNPYNYDSDELSDLTGTRCPEPSLTAQEFLEESDINYIADRFMRTGEIKQVIDMPTSGDFRGTWDFQSSMNLIVQAKQQFMQLPAKIRSRFDNDPQKLIDFLENEDNRKEAIALGLVDEPTIHTPQELLPESKASPSAAPEAPKASEKK